MGKYFFYLVKYVNNNGDKFIHLFQAEEIYFILRRINNKLD
jgi:hypothetical protein